ncbi:MAG: 16S rRNA (uracil(1498)-N(3))-methyltransferase [Desulfovibrio sp.]
MHTFFVEPQEWNADIALTGGEAHHVANVLRLSPGEKVCLLDGKGREGTFEIVSLTKKAVRIHLLQERVLERDCTGVTLAIGWGKEVRRGWLLEKSVELGAHGVWFWRAERSQHPLPRTISPSWTSSLVAGAKQCRNAWLPELRVFPDGINALIEEAKIFDHLHILSESTHSPRTLLTDAWLSPSGRTLCVIGPEGGFSQKELDAFTAAGFQSFSLGSRILRWETAALLTLGLHWWKKQQQ